MRPTIDPDAVYQMKELPDLLGVSRSTAARLVRDGEIRSRPIGRTHLVSGRALVDYLDGAGRAEDVAR